MLKFLLIPLVAFAFIPLAFAQNTPLIDQYFSNLFYLFDDESISIFYPLTLMLLTLLFTSYALSHRTDVLSSIFSIGAVPLCIILSLMFISPASFDLTTNTFDVEIITDIDNNVFTDIKNHTATTQIITNEPQFRFIFSNLFSLFAIFNGLMSVLIITKFSKE